MTRSSRISSQGFTIIELLVVVSIIALLVGILLPAIGKARDQAQLTRSQANIKQLGTAAVTYSGEWNERQVTWIDDNIASYGTTDFAAFNNYSSVTGNVHPWMILGWGRNPAAPTQAATWFIAPPPGIGGSSTPFPFQPITFTGTTSSGLGYGSFRFIQARAFHQYVNGKWYDPTFYAPKDKVVYNAAEPWFENPDEFTPNGSTLIFDLHWSSYCMSPAAMFNPQVMGKHPTLNQYYINPWTLSAGFRSPSPAQCTYSNLKTQFLEHNWCQNRKRECNPGWAGGPYDDCTPYYYNAALDSQPVAQFYDGHIEGVGMFTVIDANSRVAKQTGQANHGLWSMNCGGLAASGGGAPANYGNPSGFNLNGGYFMSVGFDSASSSFHTLTIDGIKGRDLLDR
jgi:prepilin-type N-terminal cleavage/methylation domain-containing protein